MNEILAVLNNFIAAEILSQPGRIIDPDAELISSGLIDSFHLVDLALLVEEKFAVHIDDSELTAATFNTLNQLVSLIQSRKP